MNSIKRQSKSTVHIDEQGKSLHIPAQVKVLRKGFTKGRFDTVVFEGLSHLREIEADAFQNHEFLKFIQIPTSVTAFHAKCFGGCRCLRRVEIPPGSLLSRIEDSSFAGSAIEFIFIPSGVKFIGNSCFSRCKSLSTVLIESGCCIASLAMCAFAFCSSLQSICIPRAVLSIESQCFIGCDALSNVDFEPVSQLREIVHHAFANCQSLRSISLPSSVEILQHDCFSTSRSLSRVQFESGSKLQFMGSQLFLFATLETIVIPGSVETIASFCFHSCYSLASVSFEPGSRLREIGGSAFGDCPALHSLCIPSSVRRLQDGWCACSLTTLTFESPSQLEGLGLRIPTDFYGADIQIPSSTIEVVFRVREQYGASVVVNFDRESNLRRWKIVSDWLFKRNQRAFARFSEATLRYFREE
jgi:hypothetical protein